MKNLPIQQVINNIAIVILRRSHHNYMRLPVDCACIEGLLNAFSLSVQTPLQPASIDGDTSPFASLMLENRRQLRNGKYMRFGRHHSSSSADIADDSNARSDSVAAFADNSIDAPHDNKRQELEDVDGFTRYI